MVFTLWLPIPLKDNTMPETKPQKQRKEKRELEKTRQLSDKLSAEERLWLKAAFYEASNQLPKAAAEYGLLYSSSPENLDYGLSLIRVLDRIGRDKDASDTVQELRKLPSPLREDPRIDIAEALVADSQGDYARELTASTHAEEKEKSFLKNH